MFCFPVKSISFLYSFSNNSKKNLVIRKFISTNSFKKYRKRGCEKSHILHAWGMATNATRLCWNYFKFMTFPDWTDSQNHITLRNFEIPFSLAEPASDYQIFWWCALWGTCQVLCQSIHTQRTVTRCYELIGWHDSALEREAHWSLRLSGPANFDELLQAEDLSSIYLLLTQCFLLSRHIWCMCLNSLNLT